MLLGNGDGTFQAPRDFAAGSGPHGIAVGDFNRDGAQDLAVADLGPYPQRATTVAVLLGQGDGTFRAPQTFEAGRALTGVAIGDFNRDGLQDLTLSSGDDATVSVLLGNGNGTFQPVRSFGAGSSPKSVAVGDLNADQMPDVIVTDHFSDTVSVLLGNGDGTFLARQWVETGRNPAWVSVGDLNGDGVPDLAVANWFATTVSVLPGKGDGTFHRRTGLRRERRARESRPRRLQRRRPTGHRGRQLFLGDGLGARQHDDPPEGRDTHVQPARGNVSGTGSGRARHDDERRDDPLHHRRQRADGRFAGLRRADRRHGNDHDQGDRCRRAG